MRIQSMLLAALLAVPGLAFAQAQSPDYPMDQDQQQQRSQTREHQPQQQQQQGQQGIQQNAQHQQALQQFKDEDNYKIEGKIASVNQEQLTITREDLPEVELVVPQGAEVKLDGDDVDFQQLQPGQDIKATFNVADNTPLAVELEADRTKEQKEMQKQEDKLEKDENREDSSPW